jgi:superfamily II DNA helicase RecQ
MIKGGTLNVKKRILMSHIHVLTISFDYEQQTFDTQQLTDLQRAEEVISYESYFTEIDQVPHLVLIVTTRSKFLKKTGGMKTGHHLNSQLATESGDQALRASKKAKQKINRQEVDALLATLSEEEHKFFEYVRTWRKAEAKRLGIPSYQIMSDRALYHLIMKRPHTLTALQELEYFGKSRVKKYGQQVITLVKNYEDKFSSSSSIRSHALTAKITLCESSKAILSLINVISDSL